MFIIKKNAALVSDIASTAILAAVAAHYWSKRQVRITTENLTREFKEKEYETHRSAFHAGWDDSRRAIHCFCAEHKDYCPLNPKNLYPKNQD